MQIASFRDRLRRRSARQQYREMVRRFYADGGDDAFRFDYPLGPDSLVLDVGGYEGQWASDLYARRPCRIEIFEPVPAFANRIRTRFEHNSDIRTHAVALGAATRRETISVRGASSSLYKAKKSDSVEISFVDVHEWFAENAIEQVDLMKINIEGGEYELLERMIETGLVPRVTSIQVQFHNFAPDAEIRMERIQAKLGRSHELTYQYRFVWENWASRNSRRG